MCRFGATSGDDAAGVNIELGFRCGGTIVRGTTSFDGFHSDVDTARCGGTTLPGDAPGAAEAPATADGAVDAAGAAVVEDDVAPVGAGVQGGVTEDLAAGWSGARRICVRPSAGHATTRA